MVVWAQWGGGRARRTTAKTADLETVPGSRAPMRPKEHRGVPLRFSRVFPYAHGRSLRGIIACVQEVTLMPNVGTRACVHHWVLSVPDEDVVRGRCKRCGATREYPASLDGASRQGVYEEAASLNK